MEQEDPSVVAVCVEALDATTARSVEAFLDAKHRAHFTVTDRDRALIWMVDLDQPHGAEVLAAAGDARVVIGVGFAADPPVDGCRRYVQKPLTGAALVDALADAATLAGRRPRAETVVPLHRERASHARDVFTRGQPYVRPVPDVARRAPQWDKLPERTARARTAHARTVHRAPRLVDLSDPVAASGTGTGSAAEALGRRSEVEPIDARDLGDLNQPSVLAAHRYDPSAHLDGRLRDLATTRGATAWELRNRLVSIAHDPTSATVVVRGGEAALRHGCSGPLDDQWELLDHRTPPGPAGEGDGSLRLPLDVLRWNTAVWCSKGRLAEGIDPFALATATAWPDLTRCALTPAALPIVASLAAAPVRPVDLIEQLGVPCSHVFVVISALEAAGLLDRPGTWLAPAAPPQAAPRAERSVIKRLLGRLRAA